LASIKIIDYIDVGSGGLHSATSWQIAKDSEFKFIIDESLNDQVNIKEWHSMLPKLPIDGVGYYADLDELYARVKIHVGEDNVSEWFPLDPESQNIQDVTITEGDVVTNTTSTAINMN